MNGIQEYSNEKCCENSFGPVKINWHSWRIRINYEINNLIQGADIVRFKKSKI